MTANVRLSAALVAGLIVAGCAATAQNVKPSAARSAAVAKDPTCLTDTGIRFRDAQCSAFGRSYTDEDIRNTGATQVGDALQLLDPAITVHR
jgi:hypothetical protein